MGRAFFVAAGLIVVLLGLLMWTRPTQSLPSAAPGRAGTQGPDLRVALSESQLNRQIAGDLEVDPTFGDPSIDLLPMNRARISATLSTRFLGQSLSIRPGLMVHLGVVAGRVVTVPEGLDVEGIPIPSWAVEVPMREVNKLIGDRINASVQPIADLAGVNLTDLSTTEDSLVLDFAP